MMESRNQKFLFAALSALLVFLLIASWQFVSFELRPADDFYQPQGYIRKVNQLIHDGKIYYSLDRTRDGLHPVVHSAKFDPEDEAFFEKSWLKQDIDAFNDGNADVFLIDQGRLQGVNIYRHRIESPVASDWIWRGRIYSQSAEGYAYLWNSRRTMKLFRPPLQDRASAKAAQSEFREVVYGRGNFFQTGLGITLKGRSGNRIADVYALGDNIVFKSYANDCCYINGHNLPKGEEERLEEGDLVQVYFERNGREEFLFHDFSQKPLSFLNVFNGRLKRTNLDASTHFVEALSGGIENAVRKDRGSKPANFDVHLALDEDLQGLAQTTLENYGRTLSKEPFRASCTVMDAVTGQVLALASLNKENDDINGNMRLHPVGSATKIFLSAAATQNYPDLLDLQIDPYPAGEENNLLGYPLKEGIKLLAHAPGPNGLTDFPTYIAKSCNRYHAILMALSLARDSAANTQKDPAKLHHGILFTTDPVDETNGKIYLAGDTIANRPDLSYFLTAAPDGRLECNNLDSSEIALNLERLFDVKRKYVEGSSEYFTAAPWNLLFAKLGIEQRPDIYPAFYGVMPQNVNLGLNLSIDFRLDFISIIFGGATNRWNNVKLAEAISRLTTGRKVQAKFVDKISDEGRELQEPVKNEPLGLNPTVQQKLLEGMEGVCLPGGTAGDLAPVLEAMKARVSEKYTLEFYGKTGTPFRKEIRLGQQELYSSVLLVTAVLRDRATGNIQDALSFSAYVEDQGEHKAVELLKQALPRILSARGWLS